MHKNTYKSKGGKKQKQKEFLLTESLGCRKEKCYVSGKERKTEEGSEEESKGRSEKERKRGLRARPVLGSTHRGRWAIGPGSTSPSLVLTPAAFVALVRAAVVVTGRRVAQVVDVRGQSHAFTFSFVLLPPVAFTIAPVVRPPVYRAVVVAGMEKKRTNYCLVYLLFKSE